MVTAILPGTFDPVTNGHLDLIERAGRCFDHLVVAIGHNIAKTPWFTISERVQMLRDAVPTATDIVVFQGLLIDCAREVGATVVVKGLRDATDLSFELIQSTTNRQLGDLETLLLPTNPQWLHVSSSLVRELTRWGGDTDALVPAAAARLLKEKRAEENWARAPRIDRQPN